MEKILTEEESAWSTQEAAAAAEEEVVEDVTLEVETATEVDLVGGGHLALGLDIASWWRTSPPPPPGRI